RKGCLSRPLTPISPTSTRFSRDSPSRRRRKAPHRNQVNSSFFCSWPTRIPLPIAAGALVHCSACPFRSSSLRSDLLHFLLSPLSFCLRTTHYDVKPFGFLSLISISSSYSIRQAFYLLSDLNAILFVDCNVAEPIIYEKLEASNSNLVLLRAYVGDRPTWRNPSHPWRVDPRFKLKGVPTLIRWENEAVAGRLEDYEAHIGDKIDSILASN
ncbi:unnamed protein product, partial [Musa acuminata var. zebrina]